MEVLIVGAGAMGRWFAGLPDSSVDVAFVDTDAEVARDSADEVGGRSIPIDSPDRFDVVCIAVPLSTTTPAIKAFARSADHAILDLSGVMGAPVRAMRTYAADKERLSMHPLFAPENAPGTIAIVGDAPGPVTDRVRRWLEAAGNTLFETTPTEHDTAMETVQAKTHAAIIAFALAADNVPDPFHTPVSKELVGLVETMLGGNPRVYAEIQDTFPGAEEIADAARRIAQADTDEFERLYREASERYEESTDHE